MGLGKLNPFRSDSIWQSGLRTITGAFENVLQEVGNVVSKVGNTFSAITTNILNDPLPTIASIALTSVGVPPQVVSLIRTAAQGGDMEDMVLSVAASYAGGQIGQQIGGAFDATSGLELGDLYVPDVSRELMTNLITNASGSAATALLQGKKFDEILQAGVTGAISSKFSEAIRTEFGVDPKSLPGELVSSATKGAVQSIMSGRDPALVISSALANTAIGAGLQNMAGGIKSTINDLKTVASDYTEQEQNANNLRDYLEDEYTSLASNQESINELINEYSDVQQDLIGARDSIELIKQAFNEAETDWKNWIQPDSAFNKAIEKSGYVKYGDVNTNLYARPEDLELKASSFYNAKLVPGEIIQFSPGNYAQYLGNYGQSSFLPLSKSEVYARSTLKDGAESVTILPPLPKSVEQFGGVSDEGQSLLKFAQKQVDYLNNNIEQLDAEQEGSLANKTQTAVSAFNAKRADFEAKQTEYQQITNDLIGISSDIEDLLAQRDEQLLDLNGLIEQYIDSAANAGIELVNDVVDQAVDIFKDSYQAEQDVVKTLIPEESSQKKLPSSEAIPGIIPGGIANSLQPKFADIDPESFFPHAPGEGAEEFRPPFSMPEAGDDEEEITTPPGLDATSSLSETNVDDYDALRSLIDDMNFATPQDLEDIQRGFADIGSTYTNQLNTAIKDITAKVNEYESYGATRDEAMSAAIDDMAETLGQTRQEFLERLGETQSSLNDRIKSSEKLFAEQMGGLQTDLIDRIGAFERAGLSRDDAIKQSITELADELGDTEAGLLEKLGTTESALKEQIVSGLEGVTTKFGEQIGGLKTDLVSRIQAFENAGLSRDQATRASLAELADELGETEEGLLSRLGTTESQLKSEISGVETRLGEKISGVGEDYQARLATAVGNITNRINEFEAYGATRDEALSAAIDSVADELGLTKDNLLAELGETESTLGARITESEQAFAKQLGTLQTDLVDRIGAFERAGLTRDDAIKQSITELAGELGDTEEGLLQKLGTTEQQLKTEIGGVEERLGAQIGTLGTEYEAKLSTAVKDITAQMNEFEAYGATRDEALQAAIDNVASELGLAREDFLSVLGETESSLGSRISASEQAFAQQLGSLQTDLVDRIGAFERAGLSRDDAIKQSITELADELGDTEEGLLQKLGTTEQQLQTQIGGVEERLGAQIGTLGREYETKLSTAVSDITDRMNEFEAYGATRDEALQAAIDNVAEQLGLTSQDLLDQLELNQQQLQKQIEASELEYAKQVTGLGEQVTGLGTEVLGVKTGLETLGQKVGQQVGGLGSQVSGLGTQVTGIEQALAKQPELWANLIAGLQKGFGTQIGGLQSQLTAQQKAQQAQAAQQQAAMMSPKFEAFYANIPGYKPFDVRQFSSDFYDEE